MVEFFVIIHDNSDKLEAIFFDEAKCDEYMEEHSIFTDLTSRRVEV